MNRKIASGTMLALLLTSVLSLAFNIQLIKAEEPVIENGGFETGDLTGWSGFRFGEVEYEYKIEATNEQNHSGGYSAVIGIGPDEVCSAAVRLCQESVVPPDGTLSFWMKGSDKGSDYPENNVAEVYLYYDPGGPEEPQPRYIWGRFDVSWDWLKVEYDISRYAGSSIEIWFQLEYRQGEVPAPRDDYVDVELYIDDVIVSTPPVTVIINPDGSITPATAPISTVDNVTYIFTDNIFGKIVVKKSDIIVDGNGCTLSGSGSGNGVHLSGINNVTMQNTNIKDFYYGIYLSWASYNTISENNITDNTRHGIYLDTLSLNNTISENNIEHNEIGISFAELCYSNNSTISGNYIANNDNGIWIQFSSNNEISENNVTQNHYYGIVLSFAYENNIVGNSITKNDVGMWIREAERNTIYHNNFVSNTYQVRVTMIEKMPPNYVGNTWDDGYPSGGNYWSDYEERYPGASELDGSGIWDTPYVIEPSSYNNTDHYPFTSENGWVVIDTDGDGLPDSEELAGWDVTIYNCTGHPVGSYHVTSDPSQADTDADGLTDLEEKEGWDIRYRLENPSPPPRWMWVEYHVSSDPQHADGDTDGLNDQQEKIHKTDPNRANTDCDGAWDTNDGFEVTYGLNPLDFDTDDDGLSDGVEIDLWIEAAGYSPEDPSTIPPDVLSWAIAKANDPVIPCFIDTNPGTLNLKSNGEWITVYIELAEGYYIQDIDVSTIMINNTISVDPDAPTDIGDYDFDGMEDLMVKFKRASIVGWLGTIDYSEDTGKSHLLTFTITGKALDMMFQGSDTVKALCK